VTAKERFDAIIILGAGAKSEREPSQMTLSRLLRGLTLFKEGVADWIIISGNRVETKAILNTLTRLGVPTDRIIVENRSRTTLGNAYYTKKIAQREGFRKLIVVTSDYHKHRCALIFHKIYGDGFEIKITGSGNLGIKSEDIIRENMLTAILKVVLNLLESEEEVVWLAEKLATEL